MSKLNKVFAIIIVVLVLLFVVLFYFYHMSILNQNLDKKLIKVPYSNQTIDFGVQVNASMVSYKNVPSSILKGDYYLVVEDIIGKCVRDDTRLIEGSIFYKDLLVECKK